MPLHSEEFSISIVFKRASDMSGSVPRHARRVVLIVKTCNMKTLPLKLTIKQQIKMNESELASSSVNGLLEILL